MSKPEDKVWGTTQLVYRAPGFEVHRIAVKRDGYCSLHVHRGKSNTFWIESGQLLITDGQGYEKILCRGEAVTVRAGQKHLFRNMWGNTVIAYEIYAVDVSNDIERFSEGGCKRVQKDPFAHLVLLDPTVAPVDHFSTYGTGS